MESVGDRVRAQIESLGMKQVDVAKSAGMTPDALSRALRDERQFKLVELASIADFVHASVHWLITGDRDPYELKLSARHDYDRNAQADVPHDWNHAARIAGDVALAYAQVGLGPRETQTSLPSYSSAKMAARHIAALLSDVRGDQRRPYIEDFPGAVEAALGIDVFIVDGEPMFKAYSAASDGLTFIVAHTGGSWFRINWNLAHELGHIVRGDLAYSDEERYIRADEAWANAFAAELLAPEETIRGFDWGGASETDLAHMVLGMGVSTETVRNRLTSLKIQPRSGALVAAVEKTTHELARQVLDSDRLLQQTNRYQKPRFPRRIVEAHTRAVQDGKTDGQVLAWMLGAAVEDVNPGWNSVHTVSGAALAAAL
ncbi:helix-turn-helix domain-containing protein [Arthrobacter silvisoli]|uniref:helix-turn-helix domain-containing protein n=1 Tax=Arthrobacter silvisoli TaxID=2291022 RepID=UPI000E216DC7|nr:XRE family transcriptional regulator [Arthrobacter silvisoli]